jgi:parallel beta-helix repeat protein
MVKFRSSVVVFAVWALALAASTASAAPSKINKSTCPQTISQPGDYELTVDVGPCASGTNGIVITSRDVSLQLKGHRVIGSTNPAVCNTATGILVGFQADPIVGVRVFGAGSIENFRVGFWSRNAADSFAKDLSVSGQCGNLFSFGLVLQSSNNWKLDNNLVREPGNTSTGILLESGCDNNVLVHNDVNDTIALYDSSNNTIVNNVANDDAGGIFLGTSGGPSAGSNNNQIHANTASNNTSPSGAFGLWINAGTGNNVTGNTALGNTTIDVRDDTPQDANKWRGNTFGTANQTWIQ